MTKTNAFTGPATQEPYWICECGVNVPLSKTVCPACGRYAVTIASDANRITRHWQCGKCNKINPMGMMVCACGHSPTAEARWVCNCGHKVHVSETVCPVCRCTIDKIGHHPKDEPGGMCSCGYIYPLSMASCPKCQRLTRKPVNISDLPPTGEPEYQEVTGAGVDFPTGATRSARMPFYSAIPHKSLRRVALRATGAPAGQHLEDGGFIYEGGSLKYGYGNWAKGLPMEDTFNHVIEHLFHWKSFIERGLVPQDDDLAAAAWGILLPLMTFEREYAAQHRARAEMALNLGTRGPQDLDKAMADRFPDRYLLQPLAPEEPKK